MDEVRKKREEKNDLEIDLDRWRSESPAAGRYSAIQEKRKDKETRTRQQRKDKSEAQAGSRRAKAK